MPVRDPLELKFEQMGATLRIVRVPERHRVHPSVRLLRTQSNPDYEIDVARGGDGSEVFILRFLPGSSARPEVMNVDRKHRHLVLSVGRDRYLCGHDERHWFVAGIPTTVHTVRDAIAALRPPDVPLDGSGLFRRRTRRHARQGEWFFIPAPGLDVPRIKILKNEPIRRGRNKPHICQELYREGGTQVHVCIHYPNGVTEAEWQEVAEAHEKNHRYCKPGLMMRDATVYVRGKIKHPDHKTLVLQEWHRVLGNLEVMLKPMAFLD